MTEAQPPLLRAKNFRNRQKAMGKKEFRAWCTKNEAKVLRDVLTRQRQLGDT